MRVDHLLSQQKGHKNRNYHHAEHHAQGSEFGRQGRGNPIFRWSNTVHDDCHVRRGENGKAQSLHDENADENRQLGIGCDLNGGRSRHDTAA